MMAKTPRSYRFVIAFLRLMVRVFFRRVIVIGKQHVPESGGGIVVSWHPNGLIDPGLVLTQFPRKIVFGARHGIFRYPLLGTLMRKIGTVPIYRAADLPNLDKAARAKANSRSLEALASEIARGSFSALFPEGVSHDAPHLKELKTGAARLYYQARALQPEGHRPAVIIPVGLHYDAKDLFRSNALVEFFPPLELPAELEYREGLDTEESKARARALTDEIERVLHEVVLATESWELHHLMHRARKLIRAERAARAGADPGRTNIDERVLGFARVRAAYDELRRTHPERVGELLKRVNEYNADLHALGIEDHELDRSPKLGSRTLAVILLVQALTIFFLLPPVVVIGYAVNGPTALLLIGLSRLVCRHRKDEATVKLLVGVVLFPLTWLLASVTAFWAHAQLHAAVPTIPDIPIVAGLTLGATAALGGAVAVRYLRFARETVRALRVRFTRRLRRAAIERLRAERATLHDALIAFSQDIELPGEVLEDGRVVGR